MTCQLLVEFLDEIFKYLKEDNPPYIHIFFSVKFLL
jgi:hypothetical protein